MKISKRIMEIFAKVILSCAGLFVSLNAQWAKSATGDQFSYGASTAVDGSGNVYVAGRFYGTVDFDPGAGTTSYSVTGHYETFFAKYNSSGNLVWAKDLPGSSDEIPTKIVVDGSGNVYITGWFYETTDFDPDAGTSNLTSAGGQDVFFAKYNSSGTLQWAKNIGTTSDERSYSIAVDASGNVYITGFFNGTVDFDPDAGTTNVTSHGTNDAFFAKYSSSGAIVWAKNVGVTGSTTSGTGLRVDGSSNVYVIGEFELTVDLDPGAGTSSVTSNGFSDVFFAKYNSSGVYQWGYSVGGTSDDFGIDIALDAFNQVHITGSFSGTVDFDPHPVNTDDLTSAGSRDVFYAQYDNSGNWLWAYNFGGTSDEDPTSIAVDGSGNVLIAGSFSGTADFDPSAGTSNHTSAGFADLFFAKYNSAGDLVWAKTMGASFSDEATGIAVDGTGNVYVAGDFHGTVDFDPGAGTSNLTSANNDIFFAMYLNTGLLPVEMTLFDATASGPNSRLHWSTATELNNYGFEIERRQAGVGSWQKVGFVAGSGTSGSPREYSFVDRNLAPGRYGYRVKQTDKDGSSKYTGEVEVEVGLAPKEFNLFQNYPNPFNPTTTISFTVPVDGHATLKVFDMLGREVATLVNETVQAGYIHQVPFDASGLASGLYYSSLESSGRRIMQKMQLLK